MAGARIMRDRKADKMSQKVQRQWRTTPTESSVMKAESTVGKAIFAHRSDRGLWLTPVPVPLEAVPAETIAADIRPTPALVSCSAGHRRLHLRSSGRI
jgi:hypothetical protein